MTSEFSIAVHALVYLNHKARSGFGRVPVSSEALAENICTNPARVRKIMGKLRQSGLTETKEGVDGGYLFTGDPDKVTLRNVADAMETCFVSASWKSGDVDRKCLVSSGMADIMDGIYTRLDGLCRKELEQISLSDINRKIFGKNKSD